jgi:hypothetical protein
MTDPEPLRILSLGGGTQSCALALPPPEEYGR